MWKESLSYYFLFRSSIEEALSLLFFSNTSQFIASDETSLAKEDILDEPTLI